jgi:hypothetical protein
MHARGIELPLDDFLTTIRDDRDPEEIEAERYQAARAQIRESLEEMNGWPMADRMLDSEGNYSVRESGYADIVINIHSCGRGNELSADCGSYRLHSDDMRGLVIHISPMAELVFDRKTEDGKHSPFATLDRWSGLRGPLTFELRDLD